MAEPTHYHQRIQKATERLAQLQARQLLADQRQAAKAKQSQRRDEARRRMRVADLVFLAGAAMLDDAELVGALSIHLERRSELQLRDHARSQGAALLAMASAQGTSVRH